MPAWAGPVPLVFPLGLQGGLREGSSTVSDRCSTKHRAVSRKNAGAEGQTESQWWGPHPDVSSECLSRTATKGWLLGTGSRSFRQRALHRLLHGWFQLLFCVAQRQGLQDLVEPHPIPAPRTPSGAPGRHLNGHLPLRTVPLPQTFPAPLITPIPLWLQWAWLVAGRSTACCGLRGGTVGSTGLRGRRWGPEPSQNLPGRGGSQRLSTLKLGVWAATAQFWVPQTEEQI